MILDLIPSTLRMTTPIGYAVLGGIYSERSGIINLALEGMMLMGAYGYVIGAHASGSAWVGLSVGIGLGVIIALLHAVATITFHAEQIVTGIAINLLALGITEYLIATTERVAGLPDIGLPFIGAYSMLVLLLPILMVVSHVFIYFTPWGLRLRAAGESTEALKTLSLSRAKWQYVGVILSGIFAGIGGCFLVSDVHYFTKGIIGGRGYVALAAVIFGNWRPLYGVAAGLLFGFASSLDLIDLLSIPDQLLRIIPHILTMVVLAGLVGRSRPPAALGKMKS